VMTDAIQLLCLFYNLFPRPYVCPQVERTSSAHASSQLFFLLPFFLPQLFFFFLSRSLGPG